MVYTPVLWNTLDVVHERYIRIQSKLIIQVLFATIVTNGCQTKLKEKVQFTLKGKVPFISSKEAI